MPGTTPRAHMYMMFYFIPLSWVILIIMKYFIMKQLAYCQAGVKK